MILIELTAAVSADGALRTFYLVDQRGGFVTEPTDTPANTAFEPSIIDAGTIGLHAFGDGRTGGATALEVGEITLTNIDGRYDNWLNFSFEGRPVVIRTGDGGAYPRDFKTLLVGTTDTIDATADQLVIRLRDKRLLFDTPVLTATYGGSNVLPDGVDGTANDLKGKVRPRSWGVNFNVSPLLVNTSRYIFEVGQCSSVPAAYTNGAVLGKGADYTSMADMLASAPVAGGYRAWPAGGYLRLGSYGGEQITADVTEGATAADRTVGQIFKRLAINGGIPPEQISDADIRALDAVNSAEVGIFVSDDTKTTSALDQIAASVSAWYGFDAAGVLRIGQLLAPHGVPAAVLTEDDMLGPPERRAPTDNGRPIWRATVNHTKCNTVQTSGLVGSAASRAAFVGVERRSVNADAPEIKAQWLLAGELVVDTLLVNESAALAEGMRLRELYKVRRDVFDIPVTVRVLARLGIWIGDDISVVVGRYGMNAGRMFRVIGVSFNLVANAATISVWG